MRKRPNPHGRADASPPGFHLPDLVAAFLLGLSLVAFSILVAFIPSASANQSGDTPVSSPGSTIDSTSEDGSPPEAPPGPEAAQQQPPLREGAMPGGNRSAFNRPGMWIWYLSSSHGGDYARIIRQARSAGIGTLYIKSADGRNVWSQFTRSMIRRFQRAGLKVCGWHYVYGDYPALEARASAVAAQRGADCFVIDAEAEYEGRAQRWGPAPALWPPNVAPTVS